jgi:hypothetical protein
MLSLKPKDENLYQILTDTKVIAVVGHSDKPYRTSYQIAQFLSLVGYTVYPVNPQVKTIDTDPSYGSLRDIPKNIDLVNIFRRSEYLSEIIDEAIAVGAKTIWAQSGIYNESAAQKAQNAGLNVIMNACIKVEYLRLMGNS